MSEKWNLNTRTGWFKSPTGVIIRDFQDRAWLYRCPRCKVVIQLKMHLSTKADPHVKFSVEPVVRHGCGEPMEVVRFEKVEWWNENDEQWDKPPNE